MRVVAVVNKGGGTAAREGEDLEERLLAAFRERGVEVDLRLVESSDLPEALDAAAREKADAVVAGGGDGTISLAAEAAVRHDRTLGVLPLGTLNHLARDAGIPFDIEGAVEVIAAGHVHSIDVAEVNERIFVNNSSIGIYPFMVRHREKQQKLMGRNKRVAMLVASVRALRHFGRRRLTIKVEGRKQPIVTPLLFIGNNRYETSLLSLGQRTALDRGELCLYAMLVGSRAQMIGLALRGIVGTLDQQRDFISLDGITHVEIDSSEAMLNVGLDGEALHLDTPLDYRVRAKALRLLMPPPKDPEAQER